MKPQKKDLYYKICKKTILAHEFWSDNLYLGESQASKCSLVAPSLLLSLEHNQHNSRLGGTALVWGAQAVIRGARPRNAPRGVGPAASLQQFIEL